MYIYCQSLPIQNTTSLYNRTGKYQKAPQHIPILHCSPALLGLLGLAS